VVEFIKDGVTHVMAARKGIIVSAGQFSSVILQRTGIGKSTDLATAGIQTLVETLKSVTTSKRSILSVWGLM
jgi:choline dehydrogenase